MKTKKFNKRLTLNKETIDNLSRNDLQKLNAGGDNPKTQDHRITGPCACPTRITNCLPPC